MENAAHRAVADVPVTVTAFDATFLDEAGQQVNTDTLSTKDDGLTLKVTPTGTSPRLDIELASPAEVPVVQQSVDLDTQRVVSTGGEEKLTATAQASAAPPLTTTTPQVPSKIPAGGTPDTPVAQAAMETRLSGGAIAGILGVLVLGGLAMWQLVLRKRERI